MESDLPVVFPVKVRPQTDALSGVVHTQYTLSAPSYKIFLHHAKAVCHEEIQAVAQCDHPNVMLRPIRDVVATGIVKFQIKSRGGGGNKQLPQRGK